jgi:hypothetical protein
MSDHQRCILQPVKTTVTSMTISQAAATREKCKQQEREQCTQTQNSSNKKHMTGGNK